MLRAGAGVGAHAPLAVLDIEADRREIVAEHAGVHRETQLPPVRRQVLGERGETAVGLALGVGPVKADVVAARVEAADGVATPTRSRAAHRRGRGLRRRGGEAAQRKRQRAEGGEPSRGLDRRLARQARMSASWGANRANSSAERPIKEPCRD